MKFNFSPPQFCFNPFKITEHNGVTHHRLMFHLLHWIIGAIPCVILSIAHVQPAIISLVMAVLAIYVKFTWIDTAKHPFQFHPWVVPQEIMVWDFIGDFVLTMLMILVSVGLWQWVIPVYYLASIIADPY